MAKIENSDGGYDTVAQVPDYAAQAKNLFERGYTRDNILDVASRQPTNKESLNQLVTEFDKLDTQPTPIDLSPTVQAVASNFAGFLDTAKQNVEKVTQDVTGITLDSLQAEQTPEQKPNLFAKKVDTETTSFADYLDDKSDGLSIDEKMLAWELNKDRVQAIKEITPEVDRDFLGVVQDTTLSVAKGGVAVGKSLYSLADRASNYNLGAVGLRMYRGLKNVIAESDKDNPDYQKAFARGTQETVTSIEDKTSGYEKFEIASEFLSGLQTQTTQSETAKVKTSIREAVAKRDASLEEKAINGDNAWYDVLGSEAMKAGDVMGIYAEHPTALVDVAIESALQFLVPAGAATAARNSVLKSGKEITEALTKKADNVAVSTSMAATGLMEGANSAAEAELRVLDMDIEKLQSSQAFQELLSMGLDEGSAKQALAENVGQSVFLANTAVAALASKLTGTAKLEANLFKQSGKKGLMQLPFKAALAATQELSEEGLQSAAGTVIPNAAIKFLADSEQKIAQDLGVNMGTGMIAGAAMGGTLSTVSNAANLGKDKATQFAERIQEVNAVANGEDTQTLDTENENYDAENALDLLFDRVVLSSDRMKEPEARKEVRGKMRTHLEMLQGEALQAAENAKEDPTTANKKELDRIKSVFKKRREQYQKLKEWESEGNIAEVTDLFSNAANDPVNEEQVTKINQVLGSSPDAVSDETLTRMLDNNTIPEETRQVAQSIMASRKANDRLNEASKNLNQVNNDIINGGKGMLGIADYASRFSLALDSGELSKAGQAYRDLMAFGKRHAEKLEKAKQIQSAMANGDSNVDKLQKQYTETYGGYIDERSSKIVDMMQLEVAAIRAKGNEFKALTKLVQKTPTRSAEVDTSTAPENESPNNVANEERQPVFDNVVDPEGKGVNTVTRDELDADDPRRAFAEQAVNANFDEIQEMDNLTPVQKASLKSGLSESLASFMDPVNYKRQAKRLVRNIKAFTRGVQDYTRGEYNDTKNTEWYEIGHKLAEQGKVYRGIANALGEADSILNTVLKTRRGPKTNNIQSDPFLLDKLRERDDRDAQTFITVYDQISEALDKRLDDLKQTAANVQKRNKAHFYDMMLLENTNGLKTALTTSVMGWLANTGGTVYNTNEDINQLFGFNDKNYRASREMRKVFNRLKSFQTTQADALGNDVLRTLGIQHNSETSAESDFQLIANEIGLTLLSTMEEVGYIKRVNVKASAFAAIPEFMDQQKHKDQIFIAMGASKTETGYKLTPELDNIITNMVNSPEMLKNTVGVDDIVKMPTFEPVKAATKKIKKVGTKVPKKIQKVLKKHNARPMVAKQLFGFFDMLSEDAQLEMSGYLTDEDKKKIPKYKHEESVDSINESIGRNILNVVGFIRNSGDRPFYVEHEVWSNMRMGIINSVVNPQASKITRHLVGYSDHYYEIDPTKDTQALLYFKMAILQALGVKQDRMSAETALNEFDKLLAETDVQNALEAIETLEMGGQNLDMETRREAEAALIKLARERGDANYGGENLATVDALYALSRYSETESFDSDLALEVDGVTNGVVLSVMQLGAFRSVGDADELFEVLQGGGVYHKNSPFDHFGTYREKGVDARDFYERLGDQWLKIITQKLNNREVSQEDYDALIQLVPDLRKAARKLSKSPTMVVTYGAGIEKIVSQLVDDLTEEAIVSVIGSESFEEAQRKVQLIDKLAGTQTGLRIKDTSALNEWSPSNRQYQGLANKIETIYGESLDLALNTAFAGLLEQRDAVNNMYVEGAYVLMQKIKAEEANFKKEKGIDEKGRLSKSQYIELINGLKKNTPMLNTIHGEGVVEGLLLTKFGRAEDPLIRARIGFKNVDNPTTDINFAEGRFKSVRTKSKSINSTISAPKLEEPGVSGLVKMIHHMDAAIMLDALDAGTVLNVHDAVYANPHDAARMAKVLNKATYTYSRDFSIMDNAFKWYQGIYGTLEKPTKNQKKAYALGIGAHKGAMQARKDLFENMGTVDQYSLVGGGYKQELNVLTKDQLKAKLQEMNEDFLGSDGSDFGDFNPDQTTNIQAGNTTALYNQIKKMDGNALSLSSGSQLDQVMELLIDKALRPVSVAIENTAAKTMGRYFSDTKRVELKFSNFARGGKTRSEVFAHELVHAVTQVGLETEGTARRLVDNMYQQAKKQLKPQDLYPANATQAQKDAAHADYEYVFGNKGQSNTSKDANTGFERIEKGSAYLHEFMAFGLTNESFKKALAKVDISKPVADRSERLKNNTKEESPFKELSNRIVDFLWTLFEKALYAINRKTLNVNSNSLDSALFELAQHIGNVEQNHMNQVYKYSQAFERINNATMQGIQNYILSPVAKGLRKAKDLPIVGKIAKNTGDTILRAKNVNYAGFSYAMRGFAERIGFTESELAQSLTNELKGATKSSRRWNILLRMSNLLIDQTRMKVATEVEKSLRDSWKSGVLTKEESESVYHGVLKTDLSSLLIQNNTLTDSTNTQVDEILNNERYIEERQQNFNSLRKVISDNTYRNKQISRMQSRIRSLLPHSQATFVLNQASSLANEMVNGVPTEYNSANNARNIAQMHGHPDFKAPANAAELESIIDKLVTLQAVRKTDPVQLTSLKKLIDKEMNAASNSVTDNGFMFSLQTHALYKRESYKRLFNNNPTQMVKGYIREQTDPFVSIIAVKGNDVPRAKLSGYEVLSQKPPRGLGDNQTGSRVLMIHKNRSQSTWLKTTVSYTGKQARGSTIAELKTLGIDAVDPFAEISVAQQGAITKNEQAVRLNRSPAEDETVMKPIYDDQGRITDYRYLMTEQTKTVHMNRNDDYAQAMGRMFSSIQDKVNTNVINQKVIDAAIEDARENYAGNPNGYMFIGAEGDSPKAVETWRMLPQEMREYVKQKTGRRGFMVPKSEFDKIFGYRKFWLSDWAEKKVMTQSYNNLFGFVGKELTRALARPGVRFTERLLHELTTYAKDAIVVKTGSVLVGNIVSNMLILMSEGINPVKAVKWQIEGWVNAKKYQNAKNKVVDLQHEINTNSELSSAKRKQIQSTIAELEETMRVSPVRDLVEAGVYQTIIEDLDYENDQFTYANKIEQMAKPFTDKVPPFFKEMGSIAFMTHDTRMYKVLKESTQMSDFAGRYALHKHNQQNSDMDSQSSIDYIMDTFVDYDSPTHKSIQYLNDVGIFMFTKFFIRIQKVILRQIRYKPAGVLSTLMMQQLLQMTLPNIYDTFAGDPDNWLNRGNTPFGSLESIMGMHGLNVSFIPT